MSGGHFEYKQYIINDIIDSISRIIENNDNNEKDEYGTTIGYNFDQYTIKCFKEALETLKMAETMVHHIDWLICGDYSEQNFKNKWTSDIGKLKNGK